MVKAYEFGRVGASHVANFEDPSRIAGDQRSQTRAMVLDVDVGTHGIEFIRRWDSAAVSIISLVPFAVSLIFASVWIGVSVGTFQVDAQIAVQTGFTVAGFIVTAGIERPCPSFQFPLTFETGALLIALFAFLDAQAQSK
jgi:hypothetical protein